jgi:hypothetical protein
VWVLLLRVVSVGRCGNKWNGMKGMVGNVFVVMLEVSGDVVRVRRVCFTKEL